VVPILLPDKSGSSIRSKFLLSRVELAIRKKRNVSPPSLQKKKIAGVHEVQDPIG